MSENPRQPQSDHRASAILEIALDAFIEVDASGLITGCNLQAESTFGWPRADLIGQPFQILVPPTQRHAYEEGFRNLLDASPDPIAKMPLQTRALHRSGREFPAELIVTRLVDQDLCHFVAFIRDITERKRTEEDLRESEERNRNILDHIEDGYCEVDLRGNYVFVNDAYCRMFNRSKDEVRGVSYKQFVGSEHTAMLREIYQNVYNTGNPVKSLEYELRPGLCLEQSISLKRNAKGEPVGFVAVIRDCTQRRLHEQELAKATEAAEAANRAKSEFLANMSHEIRTPMNGIMGMTELALSTHLSEEQREFLTMVRSSAHDLLVIINDILDYSKIEAGKIVLDPVPFNLSDLVGDTMKSLALSAHKKGLELAFHLDPDVPAGVVGDPVRLRQVLVNLTGNAIKFTEKGEVVVTVNRELRNGNEVKLRFAVRDTGIGIAPEKQSKIFQAFEQADSSTTRNYGGSGLGLAISKRIVHLMGGEIWLESVPAVGSNFQFTVALAPSDNPAEAITPLSMEELRGVRVLIIDDNATNRRILVELLTHWGMQPEGAESGIVGLSKLEDCSKSGRPFQLVMLDEQMPGMGGLEVVEHIRANPALRGAMVMMLTSVDQTLSTARCRQMGLQIYLIKPIKPTELLTAIRKTLANVKAVTPRQPTGAGNQPAERTLRILLAEDNPVNQKLAMTMLQKAGHQVSLAVNGVDALAKWSKGEFDLILMDVQMPEMDGFEAARRIRRQEPSGRARIPIIAMTARAMGGDRERCLEAGMDDYVSKPVSQTELRETIARHSGAPAGAAPR